MIPTRAQGNGGYEISSSHLLLPEAFSDGNGLHSTELLAQGSHGNPQTTQTVLKMKFCSPKTDSKSLLVITAPTLLIEQGEVELVPT